MRDISQTVILHSLTDANTCPHGTQSLHRGRLQRSL